MHRSGCPRERFAAMRWRKGGEVPQFARELPRHRCRSANLWHRHCFLQEGRKRGGVAGAEAGTAAHASGGFHAAVEFDAYHLMLETTKCKITCRRALAMNWTCPFCGKPQIAGETNLSIGFYPLYIGENKFGKVGFTHVAIACLNADCKEVFFKISFDKRKERPYNGDISDGVIQKFVLRPESHARKFPDFIPKPLLEDYVEACRIRDLSPKASATLSRRCLQGAVRDFCGINKSSLDRELQALRADFKDGRAPKGVTQESIEAIDHVRKIGNIGAHMEKDINLIIDIEPEEAQALIELIELLFDEWYVERDKRNRRLSRVKEIRFDKDARKNGSEQAE